MEEMLKQAQKEADAKTSLWDVFENAVCALFPDVDDENIRQIFYDRGMESESFVNNIILVARRLERG